MLSADWLKIINDLFIADTLISFFLKAMIIVVSLLVLIRKFGTSEYVTAGKNILDHLVTENNLLRIEVREIKTELEKFKNELPVIMSACEKVNNHSCPIRNIFNKKVEDLAKDTKIII